MNTPTGFRDTGTSTERPFFDPADPALLDDPYPTYARLRDETPVLYLPQHDLWAVSRYDDVLAVLRDHEAFSSRMGMSPDFARTPGAPAVGVEYRIGAPNVRVLIATDPPEHQVFRRAVAQAFSPGALRSTQERIGVLAHERIGELVRHSENGTADFFVDVAGPLPVIVLADLLGVPPEMEDEFRQWSTVICSDLNQSNADAAVVGKGMEMFRYFRRQLRGHRYSSRPSLFDSISSAHDSGVSEHELLAFCAFLMVAGIETTSNLMTNLLGALLRFPDAFAALRENPDLVGAAVEEALRYDASLQVLWRGTTREVEIGGQTVPEGARVLAMIASANRDERQFPDPDRFVLDRPSRGHLGLGTHIHYCLGARLARMEISAVLTELITATRHIEASGPWTRNQSLVLRGMSSQPVHVEPA